MTRAFRPPSLDGFSPVIAKDIDAEPISIGTRRTIDKLAESKRIKWLDLKLLMQDWVGKPDFSSMTRKDGAIVITKLRQRP